MSLSRLSSYTPVPQTQRAVKVITTAIGYHGTSVSASRQIVRVGFKPSRNPYDWLGDGVYFFQDAPTRARQWADERFPGNGAVIRAEIDLDGCIDLLDTEWEGVISKAYEDFYAMMERNNKPIPKQRGKVHTLDREVLNFLAGLLTVRGFSVRSIRASFPEGGPLYPGSSLTRQGHVQIAVRDLTAISNLEEVSNVGQS